MMTNFTHRIAWLRALGVALLVLLTLTFSARAQRRPEGTLTWALHFSLASTYFDPAETAGIITPFTFLYALHDALIKPMPQGLLHPQPRRDVDGEPRWIGLRVQAARGSDLP
jgi:hypothetical protein